MKVSTKGRYGLRALVDLAASSGGEHISLSNIAERQNISVNYLEQVFSILRKAEIIKSVKGAQGGYMLAADPAKITVGKILKVLEGSLSVTDSESGNNESNDVQYCIKNMLWDQIDNKVNALVESITLEDLVSEYRRMSGPGPIMYNI